MKHIEVTIIEVITNPEEDAGSLYDAIGEAIILSIKTNKIVRLRSEKVNRIIDPVIVRDSVAETTNKKSS